MADRYQNTICRHSFSFGKKPKPNQDLRRGSIDITAAHYPEKFHYRSIFRRFARRSAIIPSLASISRDNGSIPFWLITTKFLPLPGGQHLLLQRDDFIHAVNDELPLRQHHLLALFRRFVKEAGIHFSIRRRSEKKFKIKFRVVL